MNPKIQKTAIFILSILFLATGIIQAETKNSDKESKNLKEFKKYEGQFCTISSSESCRDFNLFLEGNTPEFKFSNFATAGYVYLNAEERSKKIYAILVGKSQNINLMEINQIFIYPEKKKEFQQSELYISGLEKESPPKKNKMIKIIKKAFTRAELYPVFKDLNSLIFIHHEGVNSKSDKAVYIRQNGNKIITLKTRNEETGISGVMKDVYYLSVFPCLSCAVLED